MGELDPLLAKYLAECEAERRQGHTLANISAELHELTRAVRGLNARISAIEADNETIRETLDEQGGKITYLAQQHVIIKRRLRRDGDDEEMDTGRFDVEELKRELAAVRQRKLDSERVKLDNVTWWKRSIIGWIVAAVAWVAALVLATLLSFALTRK